jgi:hypothetical protein
MRKHFVLWVAAALLVASAAWAAEEETGTISAIDPAMNTFTIQTDDGDRIVYRADASTRMMRDGSTVQLGDLRVGNRVEVTAPEAEGEAQRVASQVELVSAEGEAGVGAAGEAGVRAGESGVSGEAGARAGTEVGDTRMGGEAGVGAEAGPGGVGAQAQADVDVDTDDDAARMARADRLPSTASPLPLFGLLGAGAVAAGLLVRKFRG